jgi:hypothetical protein
LFAAPNGAGEWHKNPEKLKDCLPAGLTTARPCVRAAFARRPLLPGMLFVRTLIPLRVRPMPVLTPRLSPGIV